MSFSAHHPLKALKSYHFHGTRMSTSTSKASWTPEFHKMFVDVCFEVILNGKGNEPGTRIGKEGWRKIVGSFNAKAGVRYDKRQIKNHYDATRKQWKVWVKLIGDGSLKWDPETNQFGASEEDWCNYIKEIPEAAQFKFKELQFSDKLDFIFDGGIQTGEMKTSSGLKRQNDDSATSPFCGKEREKKPKNISGDCELKSAIIVNATPINTISSEQSIFSSSRRNGRAMWTPPVHKIFLDLCLQGTLKGNKPGRHFTKEGWKNIIESFNSESGLKYDKIQLKNHWDSTKEQWKIWCNLIGTSYMKWDPSNKKFEVSEEDWTNYLQSNPEAAHFRFKEPEFIDILDAIFNGNTIVGKSGPAVEQWKSDDSGVTFHLPAKEADTENLDEKTKCFLHAVASRNAIAISSTEGKRNYNIGECIECLDSMEEIEQGSDLYLFALDVFLKQEYREIFLQLKKPSLRLSWLERLQSD